MINYFSIICFILIVISRISEKLKFFVADFHLECIIYSDLPVNLNIELVLEIGYVHTQKGSENERN